MTTPRGEDARLDREGGWPALIRAFQPVGRGLRAVEGRLAEVLRATGDPAVREIANFLLQSPGKRIRPALVLLSAGAAGATMGDAGLLNGTCIDVAASVELVHVASLIHDDLIDGALIRHHRPSVPAKWGNQVAGFAGDHLCARAFQLVVDCGDPRLLAILGSQLAVMCEGELQQVAGRGDFDFGERGCLAVIEKKTASLFGACCGMGAVAAGSEPEICQTLQDFGFHTGIAFQILDDCRDLLSDQQGLGKSPGQDLQAGDITLPLLYAMQYQGGLDMGPDHRTMNGPELVHLSEAFRASQAPGRIAEWVGSYVEQARQELAPIADSVYRESLLLFAEHIAVSVSGILAN